MRTDRITPQHLQRTAIVYVRQSSPEQVRSHAESTPHPGRAARPGGRLRLAEAGHHRG
jgi:hypothetical protein